VTDVHEQPNGDQASEQVTDDDGALNNPPTQPTDATSRDAEALRLRDAHLTYRQIAEQLGWASPASAHNAVKRARADDPSDDVETRKADMDAQLNATARRLLMVMGESSRRNGPADLDRIVRAADAYVRVLDRAAKLWGLDAPAKRVIEVSVINDEALRDEIQRLDAQLIAAGVDVSVLPQPEDLAEWLASQARGVIDADMSRAPTSEAADAPDGLEADEESSSG
jgi:DNA-binding Lrp family transcriptional regulator